MYRIWLAAFAISAAPAYIDVPEGKLWEYLWAFATLGKDVEKVEVLNA